MFYGAQDCGDHWLFIYEPDADMMMPEAARKPKREPKPEDFGVLPDASQPQGLNCNSRRSITSTHPDAPHIPSVSESLLKILGSGDEQDEVGGGNVPSGLYVIKVTKTEATSYAQMVKDESSGYSKVLQVLTGQARMVDMASEVAVAKVYGTAKFVDEDGTEHDGSRDVQLVIAEAGLFDKLLMENATQHEVIINTMFQEAMGGDPEWLDKVSGGHPDQPTRRLPDEKAQWVGGFARKF